MKELADIIKAFDSACAEGILTALATVVHVDGSSYRRPGARMLVTSEGQLTGAISGGCLEGDALRKARMVIMQQQPVLVTYDTTDEDDAKLGIQLGCNGIIHILFEPLDPENTKNPINLFKTFFEKRQTAVLTTLFSLENRKSAMQGTCSLLSETGKINHRFAEGLPPEPFINDAAEVFQNHTTQMKSYPAETGLTGLYDVIEPTIHLVICGAGNDAVSLTQFARLLGWEITVIDGRPNLAVNDRFPEATRVFVSKPAGLLSSISLDQRTAFVLMTHNYNYDLAVLQQLLLLDFRYIGSLGPKKKLQRMLAELKGKGIRVTEKQMQTLYGPAGLDIGAETPEEIALSIIAEIKAAFTKKSGAPLREKTTPIHPDASENKIIPSKNVII